jgi:hypothetical protein
VVALIVSIVTLYPKGESNSLAWSLERVLRSNEEKPGREKCRASPLRCAAPPCASSGPPRETILKKYYLDGTK